ncbi:MAG: hypothetical protein KIH63_002415, partial [Candidatus Saccharibacteria bacterium]|nr:hypothetical protein [Candidatus Saccharibacteria bacterium]
DVYKRQGVNATPLIDNNFASDGFNSPEGFNLSQYELDHAPTQEQVIEQIPMVLATAVGVATGLELVVAAPLIVAAASEAANTVGIVAASACFQSNICTTAYNTVAGGSPNANTSSQIYHRRGDSQEVIAKIIESGELWGNPPSNYYKSDIPQVKAYLGPLPEGIKGFEFTTDAIPDIGSHPRIPTWSGNRQGVITENEVAKIACSIIKICD